MISSKDRRPDSGAAVLKLVCLSCGQANRLPADRLSGGAKCGTCGDALLRARPAEVDMQTLAKAASSDQLPLVVDFWAPWCGPCRMMAPEYEKAAAMLTGQARFAKIDTQRYPDAATRWNIRGIPAIVVFRAGREQARRTGAASSGELIAWLGPYMKR